MNRTFFTIHVMQNVFDIQSSRMIARRVEFVCLLAKKKKKCNELEKRENA